MGFLTIFHGFQRLRAGRIYLSPAPLRDVLRKELLVAPGMRRGDLWDLSDSRVAARLVKICENLRH